MTGKFINLNGLNPLNNAAASRPLFTLPVQPYDAQTTEEFFPSFTSACEKMNLHCVVQKLVCLHWTSSVRWSSTCST